MGNSRQVFEIGLVMAGAVSGGAYTAGVLDFLIEALDTWHDAMAAEDAAVAAGRLDDSDRKVPCHQVLLKAMSGSSAGSMTAAIVATALAYEFPHVSLEDGAEAAPRTGNPLFDSWVDGIDIRDLLDTSDIKARQPGGPSHRLLSLLNSQRIDKAVNAVLNMDGPPRRRRYVADPLPVCLTVGNLRGVPYGITMRGGGAHAMMVHGDHVDFLIGGSGTGAAPNPMPGGFVTLDRPNMASAWSAFGDAAMASGAFPFALRPRKLSRKASDYDFRAYLEPGDCKSLTTCYKPLPPDWPPQTLPYDFLCMDGGLMNNEPFDLVHALLTNQRFECTPRNGFDTHRAVLLVDPFVDPVTPGPEDERPLHTLVPKLFGAWTAQCRFKPADVVLALDQTVYSRFLVAPARSGYGPGGKSHPLAAGGLSAFLGFFSRDYRLHDYQLGRRNCQQFLRRHFTLPLDNPLFGGWSVAARAKWLSDPLYGQDPDGRHLPIVPLVGRCDTRAEPFRSWPVGRLDPESLRAPIQKRADMVFDALKDDMEADWKTRAWLNAGWVCSRRTVADKAVAAVAASLVDQQL